MKTYYNLFAGQSLERLTALSDGIFAVAMTLLVLNLQVPQIPLDKLHVDSDLWNALIKLIPNFIAYFMSFLTLGIFWVGQQTQLNKFTRSDRNLAWLHLIFLFAVTLIPFSTGFLARYIMYRTAIIIYWLNILFLGVMLLISWRYAKHIKLVKHDMPADAHTAIERRIIIAQALYGFGALLCIFNTYLSIGFIVLVQLNYVIAPRIPLLRRL